MPNQEIIIITGATASGKSEIALKHAERHGGVVINADSMQLYREAPILTAQPSGQERALVPHRLYGVLKADTPCSVAQWIDMVRTEIRSAWTRGAIPIVVGGTGMYLRALMRGLSAIPDIPPEIRTEIRSLTTADLRVALCHEDPVMAAQLNPHDSQRMARALEVIRATGQSLGAWCNTPPSLPMPEAIFHLCITELDRANLYARINGRVDDMLQNGALAEAEALHTLMLSRTLPLMRAVGVSELMAYIDGTMSWDDTIIAMKANSRHYAKRQMTWMRQQFKEGLKIKDGALYIH